MDAVVNNPKQLLCAVIPGGTLSVCIVETLSKSSSGMVIRHSGMVIRHAFLTIFFSLYCRILVDINDIVVCRRTLKTKEFKSLEERDVKCREKCAL